MEVFLLRHGDAATQAPRDELRPLSAAGKAEVEFVASACSKELHTIEKVLVSPYLRAQQTYAVAEPFLPAVPKEDCETIVPGSNPYQVIDHLYTLRSTSGVSSLLLISHQPLLGTLLDLLCAFEPGAHRMGTSAMAAIDMDIPGVAMGNLRWLRHPEFID